MGQRTGGLGCQVCHHRSFPPTSGNICERPARIVEHCLNPFPKYPLTWEVYAHTSHDREACVLSRGNQSLLARLRSVHYMGLRAHRSRVDGVSDPTCDLCGQELRILEHWLRTCPATAAPHQELFGPDSGDLGCLTSHPLECISLARRTLRLGDLAKKLSLPT